MKNSNHNKINRTKLAIIITALTTVAAAILLVAMIVTHADPKLDKIEIASLPDKTEYIEKQTLDTAGLVVKAYYGDNPVEVSDYAVDKTVLEFGDDTVTVSYTDNKITKTASFAISVVRKSLSSIEITKQPNKTIYTEGAFFDPTGTEVTAHYDNGESSVVGDWEHNGVKALTISDKSIIVSFGGKTADIPITVEQKRLSGLYLKRLPDRLEYTEGEYFDFLGLELYAKYENSSDERVYDWELGSITPLAVTDTAVTVSYTLHGVTKSVVIDIAVAAAENIAEEQVLLSNLVNLLPQTEDMTMEDLGALNYVISVLDSAELSESQQKLKDELSAKRDVLVSELPEEPEKVYKITYGIKDGLEFEDINFGGNPAVIKDGQTVGLNAATSDIAVKQGYEFTGWSMDGKTVTSISNIDSDKTVYAVFMLTPTVELIFKDKETIGELYTVNPLRNDSYNFSDANISSAILNRNGLLPIAYYSIDNKRIDSINLNNGSSITVFVQTVSERELHLPDGNLFTVGWNYKFEVDGVNDESVEIARTGSVFYIPIGAEVTITATNANIDDIILDGESIGSRLNSTVVNAVFSMAEGQYPASVTYTTKLLNMTTLSFIGQNVHSVVYPVGWNGIMADVDLENLAFVFDEDNNRYLNTYSINNKKYYFDDLAHYVFDGDTVINVLKQFNSFSLTVEYSNGKEILDGIVGRQFLNTAISSFSSDAVSTLNTILDTSNLFSDKAMTQPITKDELFAVIVRQNIIVYSDWTLVPQEPDIPIFSPVDYSNYSFVNNWNALFTLENDILSCELILAADGNYSYTTYVNGNVSANAYGIYRLNNGKIEIKTFISAYEYDIFSSDDLSFDISFSSDGLLLTKFIRLDGTKKTTFEHVLFCGSVRPVNYSAGLYIGRYNIGGIIITLLENGTATIIFAEETITAYYRVGDEGRIYLMENGMFGTGDITEILEGCKL